MVHLDYRDARPIYLQIVDGFRAQILTGVLQSGEKLPSVRELATELSINPNTIQRSYQELERQGFIYSAKGKGSFVSQSREYLEEQKQRTLDELKACIMKAVELQMDPEELIAQTITFIKEGHPDD